MVKSNFKNTRFYTQIPNSITVFRIFLAIIIITLLIVNHYLRSDDTILYHFSYVVKSSIITKIQIAAVILFLIAAFSDFLDGYLARKLQLVSKFGKIFDPISDKFLVNGVLVSLSVSNIAIFYLVILIIVRDIFVDGLRIYVASQRTIIAASWWGKIKSILLFIAIAILMFGIGKNDYNISNEHLQLINLPLYLATFACLWSGIDYFVKFYTKKGIYGSKN